MTIHVYDGMAVLRRRFDEALPGKFGRGPRSVFNEMLAAQPGDVHLWCFEGMGSKRERQKILPGYKDRPSTMTDGLHALVDLTRQALAHTRCFQIAVPRREADDVVAHLCTLYGQTAEVRVHTVDRDLLALQQHRVTLVGMKPLKVVVDKLDPRKDVVIQPSEIHLYKTLVGDQSDRVPGLQGFGPKTFVACNRVLLNVAMQSLLVGRPSAEAFVLAGVKEPTAKRIVEQAAHIKACWDVTAFLPMPGDWEDHIQVGKPDQAAGDALLKRFMH